MTKKILAAIAVIAATMVPFMVSAGACITVWGETPIPEALKSDL